MVRYVSRSSIYKPPDLSPVRSHRAFRNGYNIVTKHEVLLDVPQIIFKNQMVHFNLKMTTATPEKKKTKHLREEKGSLKIFTD